MLQLWLKCTSDVLVLLMALYQRRYNTALTGYVFTPFSLFGHISTSRRNGKMNYVQEVSLHSQFLIRPRLPEYDDMRNA